MVEVKNYMEDFVFTRIDSMIKNIDMCQCELCKSDMCAIVLNALPPKYVATREGSVYEKVSLLQLQYEVDLLKEVAKAEEIVKANPRHGELSGDSQAK